MGHSVAFSAKYNVLLFQTMVNADIDGVVVVNPGTGCVIQKLDVSFLGSVAELRLYNDDQLVILHWDDSNILKLSFLKLTL